MLLFAILPLVIPKQKDEYIKKWKLQISTKSGRYFAAALVLAFISFVIAACIFTVMVYEIDDASDNQWVCSCCLV